MTKTPQKTINKMFGIGFGELLLIFFVALLVIPPKQLPKFARIAGIWVNKARGFLKELTHHLD